MMYRAFQILAATPWLFAALAGLVGCGITRSTDTARTATEQLLISDAIDRAVESMNLQPLAGQTVFLDDSKVTDAVDRNYYISTLRQQLLGVGCELREKREEADFVVEARAGAIGTDRNDLLFGVPTTSVPAIPLVQPLPSTIPEIPIAKRKDQRGIAKIAIFAYHRASGTPVWQSGIVRQESSANDVWILGAGPFQHGTIYDDSALADGAPTSVSPTHATTTKPKFSTLSVARERTFNTAQKLAQKTSAAPPATGVAAQTTSATPPPASAVPPGAAPASSSTADAAVPKSGVATAAVTGLPAGPAAATAAKTNRVSPTFGGNKSVQPVNSAYANIKLSNAP